MTLSALNWSYILLTYCNPTFIHVSEIFARFMRALSLWRFLAWNQSSNVSGILVFRKSTNIYNKSWLTVANIFCHQIVTINIFAFIQTIFYHHMIILQTGIFMPDYMRKFLKNHCSDIIIYNACICKMSLFWTSVFVFFKCWFNIYFMPTWKLLTQQLKRMQFKLSMSLTFRKT